MSSDEYIYILAVGFFSSFIFGLLAFGVSLVLGLGILVSVGWFFIVSVSFLIGYCIYVRRKM